MLSRVIRFTLPILLLNDGRTPEQFLGVFEVDDINRAFRFEGEEFNKIMEALYAEYIRVNEDPA